MQLGGINPNFLGVKIVSNGGLIPVTRVTDVKPDLTFTEKVGKGVPTEGTLDVIQGGKLVDAVEQFVKSAPPREQLTPGLTDAPLSQVTVNWGRFSGTFTTDGYDVTPETTALLDALNGVGNIKA